MVVDTGANVSIIRKDLAQNSKLSIIWTPPCVFLQTVTGKKIQVHGKANVPVWFGNVGYHHTAYIADITDPCILGLDFLKNNNFKWDFENCNMHSKFESITLFRLQTQFESNQKIIAKSKLSLSPRTEYIIPGLVAENRKFRFGLIDYPDPASLKAGVLIAWSVVDLWNSVILVRIDNISDRTRTIQEGEGSSESVQEFAARINKLGTQIFQSGNSAQNTAVRNANDQLLQSRFISGLRNDIRSFVLSRDPLNLDESINVALIVEQNMKLNQIANDERSSLSPAQTESSVLSALTDRLEEINLRVGRLQEASSVTARKTGGNFLTEGRMFSNVFIVAFKDIHKQSVERSRGTFVQPITSPPEKRR
ncbi:retrovirus-related Pol polyprotein from transposon 412 [Trichonephila clavipes]|nr:retrovirus-related Pol polyprotein from transposon 412 [Trichonephila clavipes]